MGPTIAPESDLEDGAPATPDAFRHIAFIAGVLLLLGAWKFGIEGLME